MIIAISGKKQHGKNTVAYIVNKYTNNKFKVVAFADKLKDFVCTLINCSRKDLENEDFKNNPLSKEWDYLDDNCVQRKMTPRILMQKIGTEGMRDNVHNNVWINGTLCNYNDKCNWIITDLRFKNEFERLKELNAIIIRVNRSNIISNDEHKSEKELDDYKSFDFIIENNSNKENLENKVIELLKNLKLI